MPLVGKNTTLWRSLVRAAMEKFTKSERKMVSKLLK
jgi:hypothetical protein